jgi:hypothetical protein
MCRTRKSRMLQYLIYRFTKSATLSTIFRRSMIPMAVKTRSRNIIALTTFVSTGLIRYASPNDKHTQPSHTATALLPENAGDTLSEQCSSWLEQHTRQIKTLIEMDPPKTCPPTQEFQQSFCELVNPAYSRQCREIPENSTYYQGQYVTAEPGSMAHFQVVNAQTEKVPTYFICVDTLLLTRHHNLLRRGFPKRTLLLRLQTSYRTWQR